jgi:hypothetical protein
LADENKVVPGNSRLGSRAFTASFVVEMLYIDCVETDVDSIRIDSHGQHRFLRCLARNNDGIQPTKEECSRESDRSRLEMV